MFLSFASWSNRCIGLTPHLLLRSSCPIQDLIPSSSFQPSFTLCFPKLIELVPKTWCRGCHMDEVSAFMIMSASLKRFYHGKGGGTF